MPEKTVNFQTALKKYAIPAYHVLWALYLIVSGIILIIMASKGYEGVDFARQWEDRRFICLFVFVLVSIPVVITPLFSRKNAYAVSYVFLVAYGFMFGYSVALGVSVSLFLLAVSLYVIRYRWAAAFSIIAAVLIFFSSYLIVGMSRPATDRKLSETVAARRGKYSIVLTDYEAYGSKKRYQVLRLVKTADLGIVTLEKTEVIECFKEIGPDDVSWADGTSFTVDGTLYDAEKILN